MASAAFPALQAKDAFIVVPSDSATVDADATNNPKGYKFAFIHNAGTGDTFTIVPAGGSVAVEVYIAQGATLPIAVKQVKATGSPASDIVGFV
jgi:hypothetical protein